MRRREGAAALGVWLPLALADLFGCVMSLTGVNLRRSDVLASWCLPELAAEARRDEEEGEDRVTVESFNRLAKMFGEQ